MKTEFKLQDGVLKSTLLLHDRNNTLLKVLDFDFGNINNWYPLNSEYDIIYHVEHDSIQIVPMSRSRLGYPDYGISSRGTKLEYDLSNGLDSVSSKPIQQNNNLICTLAREMNIPCWLDDFTQLDVQLAIKRLEQKIDKLTSFYLKSYYFGLSQDEKVNFMTLSKDNREHYALQDLEPNDQKEFIAYGKLYTMLSVMRKVSKVYA